MDEGELSLVLEDAEDTTLMSAKLEGYKFVSTYLLYPYPIRIFLDLTKQLKKDDVRSFHGDLAP